MIKQNPWYQDYISSLPTNILINYVRDYDSLSIYKKFFRYLSNIIDNNINKVDIARCVLKERELYQKIQSQLELN